MSNYGEGNYGEGTYGGTAGTTPVSADLTGTYQIVQHVLRDLNPTYNVNAHITADLTAVYSVLTTGALFPVHGDLVANYKVISRIFGDFIAVYNVGDVTPSSGSADEEDDEFDAEGLKSFARRMLDYLEPVELASNDLNHYIGGIGEGFQEIEDLVATSFNGDPGWSPLMDVDRIPSKGLDWLGQFIGIRIDHDDTDEGMRQQIRAHDRWGRGTPLSIIGPASHWIPGDGKLYMSERNPNPWHITFIMVDQPGPTQTYGDLYDVQESYHKLRAFYDTYFTIFNGGRGDWDKVIELLKAAKPAGIQYTFITTLTTIYMAIYILEASYQAVYDDFATYNDVYSAPFPDINLDVPKFRQLISTRYYRNIYNQFQTYGDVRDSYVLY
jgi:hypothetical protein